MDISLIPGTELTHGLEYSPLSSMMALLLCRGLGAATQAPTWAADDGDHAVPQDPEALAREADHVGAEAHGPWLVFVCQRRWEDRES
jgi:hypothetical protein